MQFEGDPRFSAVYLEICTSAQWWRSNIMTTGLFIPVISVTEQRPHPRLLIRVMRECVEAILAGIVRFQMFPEWTTVISLGEDNVHGLDGGGLAHVVVMFALAFSDDRVRTSLTPITRRVLFYSTSTHFLCWPRTFFVNQSNTSNEYILYVVFYSNPFWFQPLAGKQFP